MQADHALAALVPRSVASFASHQCKLISNFGNKLLNLFFCQVCEKMGGSMTVIHNASENSNYTEFMAPMMSYPEVSQACDYFSVGSSFPDPTLIYVH